MKIRWFLVSLIVFFMLPGLLVPVYADVQITSFSPSAGWAGTDAKNGSQVVIKGSDFSSDPNLNQVFFHDNKQANVIYAGESKYEYATSFGSPGSNLGELSIIGAIAIDFQTGTRYVANRGNHRVEVFDNNGNAVRQIGDGIIYNPRGIAVNKMGNIYVSGSFSDNGNLIERIGVFDKNGNFIKYIGAGELNYAGDISLDDRDYIYVLDYTKDPNGYPKFIWFDDQGNKQGSFSGIDEGWGGLVRIAVDPRQPDPPTSDRIFYVSDSLNKVIYKYDTFVPLLEKWSFPEADPMGRVVVDKDGSVYVDLGTQGIVKLNESGKLIGTVLEEIYTFFPILRTVDKGNNLYLADTGSGQCECVKVYRPADSQEIVVTVPPGAKTGPIKVESPNGSYNTDPKVFTVFDVSGLPTVTKVKLTQGLASYPLVSGKPTMIYAKIDGLFGAPGRDAATAWIAREGLIAIGESFDHYEWDFKNKKTTAYYHIPVSSVWYSGKYPVSVVLKRDNTPLYEDEWEENFNDSKSQGLLFVRFTDVPNDQWTQQDPFPWFDMNSFLYSVATFGRVYPVNPSNVKFSIIDKYGLSLDDGVNSKEELSDLMWDAHIELNGFSKEGFPGRRKVVALADRALNKIPGGEGLGGLAPLGKDRAFVWGVSAAGIVHELGHAFGLVATDKANYSKELNHHHSKNYNFENEEGAPIEVWNSLTDKLLSGDDYRVATIMNPGGPGGADSGFFESRVQDENDNFQNVDYHLLFGQFKGSSSASISFSLENNANFALSNLVIVGSIAKDGTVLIGESYLTTEDIPVTPIETGEYTLVFLSDMGTVLRQDTFDMPFEMPDSGPLDRDVLNLVRPYPIDTAKVEIRFKDQTLKTLIQSLNTPEVDAVSVELDGTPFPTISWAGSDADGDPLTYALHYSRDGGQTFSPIIRGLSGTTYVWNDQLIGGCSNGLIKVEATDGFNVGSGVSDTFSLPDKEPIAQILLPNDDSTFTEGSLIRFQGAAFDPEDGMLVEESLTWLMDDEIELGEGETVQVKDLLKEVPEGILNFPLEVGPHSVLLEAMDSDGNNVSTSISFNVVSDTDRDGFSDDDEMANGGDPNDPTIRPNRAPTCDANGPYWKECEGASTNITLDGTQSSDPDGDNITFAWSGPFTGGTATGRNPTVQFPGVGLFNVNLEVSDDFGETDSCEAVIDIFDTIAPELECNAPAAIVPQDAPISFQASAIDVCEGEVHVDIIGYDCFTYTKKGKLIDKTTSCVVDVAGNIITILDSGGVGDNISWRLRATDNSGNVTEKVCQVEVMNPSKP